MFFSAVAREISEVKGCDQLVVEILLKMFPEIGESVV
jgi:hypothetical protein